MLELRKLNHDNILGIYGKDKCYFPERFSYLHPDAHQCFLDLNEYADGRIVLTDMHRTAETSKALRYPYGTRFLPARKYQPPAWSAHNFGLAVDVAVTKTLKNLKCNKKELDKFFEGYGWFCHRRDHKRWSEEWHYNFLGVMGAYLIAAKERTTAPAVERRIEGYYEKYWLDARFREDNVKKFQRKWCLKPDGIFGPKSKRLYWYLKQEDRIIHAYQLIGESSDFTPVGYLTNEKDFFNSL